MIKCLLILILPNRISNKLFPFKYENNSNKYFLSLLKMSFLWRGNGQSETPNCKDCIDKDKRMSDYELFFNEMRDVLKKKEEQMNDLQSRYDEVSKKIDDQDVIIQSQKIFREKLIEEYEFSKKVHQEEKRQWFESKAIWHETKKQLDSHMMSLEVEKSDLEEKVSQLLEDKDIWRKHQKVLEDKIQSLCSNLKESEEKYEDLKKRMKTLEVRNVEMELKQVIEREEMETKYQEKMENMSDEQEKREEQWKGREEEYEFLIQRYQDNELDYEMRIQDMKYDLNCEIDELERKYKEKLMEKDQEWEDRIKNLNDMYDNEFLQFKEHFKNKEQKLEREKETIEQTLRYDIQELKRENMELEEAKRQMEKKRIDNDQKWSKRESELITQLEMISLQGTQDKSVIDRLSMENQRLVNESKEEKIGNVDIQKKMENEYQTLMKQMDTLKMETNSYKMEMERNQKILEETILNVIEENKINKQTQTILDEPMDFDSYQGMKNNIQQVTERVAEQETGLRQRKKKKLKRKQPCLTTSQISEENYKNDGEESFVEDYSSQKNFTMNHSNRPRDDFNQKKTTQSCGNLTNDHIIDIPETFDDYEDRSESNYDPGNFFLRLTGFINTPRVDKENIEKIKSLEEEIKTLKFQNTQYLSKIQNYECKSIIELNRKIRSGIPVRFFPYHTNNSVSNPSHINSIDIDLH